MGRGLIVATLALLGLLCAAGMGYAAYVVSRGSVAVPVTKLQQTPQSLTPEAGADERGEGQGAEAGPNDHDAHRRASSSASPDHNGRRPRRRPSRRRWRPRQRWRRPRRRRLELFSELCERGPA
jgi:hypothetical protein